MELIRTNPDEKNVVEGRFHLIENKRLNYFYVYINDLSKDDSGMYWCVFGRTEYTKIHLSVGEYTDKYNTDTKHAYCVL